MMSNNIKGSRKSLKLLKLLLEMDNSDLPFLWLVKIGIANEAGWSKTSTIRFAFNFKTWYFWILAFNSFYLLNFAINVYIYLYFFLVLFF